MLQSAIKFINLTVPSSAGSIGINIRFLQRMGVPTGQAVAAGAVDGLSETLVQISLVLVTLPFVHVAIDTASSRGTARRVGDRPSSVSALASPSCSPSRPRAKVLPPVQTALSRALVGGARRGASGSSSSAATSWSSPFALTLGAVCRAYGVDLSSRSCCS